MKKVLLTILLLILIVIAGVAAYVKFALPEVGPVAELKVEMTPERIANGEYLANHVAVCMDCHSTRDWSRFGAPVKPGTLGKGGEYFGEEAGFPGKFYSKNITPANLKDWTDGEIFRTITTGVDKYGDALFPVMPYPYYGKLDKQDVYDIIAYIRSLKPIENATPVHSVDFPMNFILNTIPSKATFGTKPPKSDTIKYGAYLTNAAGCIECHTQVNKGQIIRELAFSGGRDFKMPNGITRSANITPDSITGIGSWSENQFLERFKAYTDTANLRILKADEQNTVMPWPMYSGMDSSDLRSIYRYLRTLKPIKNEVVHFAASTEVVKK
jgi:cytochrome c553